jgi:hypothetical protein
MRRLLCLTWLLAVAFLGLASCGDDDDDENGNGPPNGDEDVVDLTAFEGCWHLSSGFTNLAPEGTPCRRAIDSVLDFFDVEASDSVFATIDTVTHLSFVPPYRGTGDYAGTNIPGRKGEVNAEFRHASGSGCSLVTTLEGDIYAEGDTGFSAPYTLTLQFIGEAPCDSSNCRALVLFEGTRRPGTHCVP